MLVCHFVIDFLRKKEDRNEHPVEKKGTKGVGKGQQSKKNSTGGGVTRTRNTSTFKKKQTISRKKETILKKTNFTPTKEKIFNFFEQQGGKIGEKQGVLRSSPIFKRKSAAKLTQESQFHEESTNTHLQMEVKARPGPGSMARKPQK